MERSLRDESHVLMITDFRRPQLETLGKNIKKDPVTLKNGGEDEPGD